jgi:hypothetical protein
MTTPKATAYAPNHSARTTAPVIGAISSSAPKITERMPPSASSHSRRPGWMECRRDQQDAGDNGPEGDHEDQHQERDRRPEERDGTGQDVDHAFQK